ncbi:MAG: adenine deaminase [Bacteroidales bacterium]|nr:adenine deaminase [Bacteroidales bacterium]MCF8332716.1 adenine deaminase [Bacteroidales bacterium]
MANKRHFILEGNIVDVVNQRIFKGRVHAQEGRITKIQETEVASNTYIIPGLIDAHVHVESSMLIPSEFGRMAAVHGTVASVSDPHEIANVLGMKGVDFMIENGKKVPFKFYFGAPSCVPATPFETSGANIDSGDIQNLLKRGEIKYLAEMMNFPGVLNGDQEVMAKLKAAADNGKPVDGHAPGVKGQEAVKYGKAGITTDHECFTMEEARDKLAAGMMIQIREGSAAKNFEELIPLLEEYPDKVMFCSDDKHPDNLAESHINKLVSRAIALGYDPMKVLRAATYTPVRHYNLDVGLLHEGDPADMVLVDNLVDFNILETYIDGELAAIDGKTRIESVEEEPPNLFRAEKISPDDLRIKAEAANIKVIKAEDGQLITDSFEAKAKTNNGFVESDTQRDILKIVVMNRYEPSKPAVGFVHNFGLKKGAIASSVAHDSHNIIAVGTDDDALVKAVNTIVENTGGISLFDGENTEALPLPVGGIMANANGYWVARQYSTLDQKAKSLGTLLSAPFMTLSFMALLVIPHLKLSDKGLFDGDNFKFTTLFSQ